MSNEFFSIEVLKTKGSKATVRLTINDASQVLPVSPSWALMLLHEATWTGLDSTENKGNKEKRSASALAKAVPSKSKNLEAFFAKSASKFVDKVELVDTRNYPIDDPDTYNAKGLGENAKRSAWGHYEIAVTDARWLEHLQSKMKWSSTSYGINEQQPVAASKEGADTGAKGKAKNKDVAAVVAQLGSARPLDRSKGLRTVLKLAKRGAKTLGKDGPLLAEALCNVFGALAAKKVYDDDLMAAIKAAKEINAFLSPSRLASILDVLAGCDFVASGNDVPNALIGIIGVEPSLIDGCMAFLAKMMKHENPAIRWWAVMRLSSSKTRRVEATALAKKALKDPDFSVREEAKSALELLTAK